MPNKNSLEAVKKGCSQVKYIETSGMMQINQQQQWVISDCGQVKIMPNIKYPKGYNNG